MDKKINQVDFTLNTCIDNFGEWVCSSCATQGADKPSAIFKLLRNKGYVFEETSAGRFDKKLFCPNCEKTTTHYKLLSDKPIDGENVDDTSIPQKQILRILSILGSNDAFTGWKASPKPIIDSKIPSLRVQQDIDPSTLTEEEITNRYQILSPEHIALKEKACRHCSRYGIRPPFMGKRYYYEGNDMYKGTCEGCGWYDGNKWTAAFNKLIEEYNYLKELESEYHSVKNTYSNFITFLTGAPGETK